MLRFNPLMSRLEWETTMHDACRGCNWGAAIFGIIIIQLLLLMKLPQSKHFSLQLYHCWIEIEYICIFLRIPIGILFIKLEDQMGKYYCCYIAVNQLNKLIMCWCQASYNWIRCWVKKKKIIYLEWITLWQSETIWKIYMI